MQQGSRRQSQQRRINTEDKQREREREMILGTMIAEWFYLGGKEWKDEGVGGGGWMRRTTE